MKHPYIDRYIYAVTKRLPAAMRDDVKAELEANIQDMMAEDPDNEALLQEKLQKLGHPRVLANNYRGSERYVIRPEYYDDYVSALKIVGTIFLIVGLVTGFLEAITALPNTGFPQVFETILNGIFDNLWEALLNAFVWTTIGFWIAGTVTQKQNKTDWKLSDLPELPDKQTLLISRAGHRASAAMAVCKVPEKHADTGGHGAGTRVVDRQVVVTRPGVGARHAGEHAT